MSRKYLSIISFGEQYLFASLVWIGLTLVLWSVVPKQLGNAQNSEIKECYHIYQWTDESGEHSEVRSGCPEGYSCCQTSGECIEL
ncbi:MAG: hypothetical protein LBF88_11345 [Planctomycetaceae bacterium]|jgi:hypothetical protein|nr:hypothetical protein [Planctomycetaceae bacterium]